MENDSNAPVVDGSSASRTQEQISRRILSKACIQREAQPFPQGCQFSPDGLCILTAESHEIALYNTTFKEESSWNAALRCSAGDTVRDYQWYPHMSSQDPSTCCFLACSRDQPVHLYDAYTGKVRASYRPYNRLDEMESPSVISFANNGQSVVTGGFRSDRMLQLFDLNCPGREANVTLKLGKTKRSKDGQKGIVSALATASLDPNLLVVGTYSPGSIYIYDLRVQFAPAAEILIDGTAIAGHGKSARKRKIFVGHDGDGEKDGLDFSAAKSQWYHSRTRGGVTQMEVTSDCQSLLSVSRRANAVLRWDLRGLSSKSTFCPGVGSYETSNDTNQRLEFTLDEQERLYIGGHDRCVRVYDLKGGNLVQSFCDDFEGAVNGVSVCVVGGRRMMATAVGSRQFPREEDWDLDSPHEEVQRRTSGWLILSELS